LHSTKIFSFPLCSTTSASAPLPVWIKPARCFGYPAYREWHTGSEKEGSRIQTVDTSSTMDQFEDAPQRYNYQLLLLTNRACGLRYAL